MEYLITIVMWGKTFSPIYTLALLYLWILSLPFPYLLYTIHFTTQDDGTIAANKRRPLNIKYNFILWVSCYKINKKSLFSFEGWCSKGRPGDWIRMNKKMMLKVPIFGGVEVRCVYKTVLGRWWRWKGNPLNYELMIATYPMSHLRIRTHINAHVQISMAQIQIFYFWNNIFI